MNVFLGNKAQVYAIDLRRDLHIATHVRSNRSITDVGWYLEKTWPARKAAGLDGGGEGQADGAGAAARVCYDEVLLKGVKP